MIFVIGHTKHTVHVHWEIRSCFLLEFFNIDQARLECTGLNTSDWPRHGDIAHPTFGKFCILFDSFVVLFVPFTGLFFPSTQSVSFLLPYLNLLPAITSFSHICFPTPFMSTETLWSSVQILPSPFSAFPFLNIILDHVHIQHEMSSAGRKTQQLYWMCSSCLRLLAKKEIAISDR